MATVWECMQENGDYAHSIDSLTRCKIIGSLRDYECLKSRKKITEMIWNGSNRDTWKYRQYECGELACVIIYFRNYGISTKIQSSNGFFIYFGLSKLNFLLNTGGQFIGINLVGGFCWSNYLRTLD